MASHVFTADPPTARLPELRALTAQLPQGGHRTWFDFRQALRPRYVVVWRDILLRHVFLLAVLAGHGCLELLVGRGVALTVAPLAALWAGFWLVSLNNFAHEAAHFNLAPNRRLNDWLAHLFVMAPFGMDAVAYRKVHWSHHRHLGGEGDTEISYRLQPTPGLLLQCLTAIYPLRVLVRHRRGAQGERSADRCRIGWREAAAWGRAVVWHGAILVALWTLGALVAAIAWIVAIVSVFPTLAALRQILEHRDEHAVGGDDSSEESRHAVNRLFGTGPFARSFGSAGFNRHLLHHWDPSISYTRFDEMEAFVLQTEAAPAVNAQRTTYFRTLKELMRGGA